MVPVSRYELWFYSVVLKDLLHKNLLTKNNSLGYPFIDKIILSTSLKSSFMKEFGPLPAVLLMFLLVGQRGVLCKAKKSISA
jgi:ribosomal protein L5